MTTREEQVAELVALREALKLPPLSTIDSLKPDQLEKAVANLRKKAAEEGVLPGSAAPAAPSSSSSAEPASPGAPNSSADPAAAAPDPGPVSAPITPAPLTAATPAPAASTPTPAAVAKAPPDDFRPLGRLARSEPPRSIPAAEPRSVSGRVAPGKGLTSVRGVLGAGELVTPADFEGGVTSFIELAEAGFLVEP